jgi:hypothetical protein
MDVTRLFFAFGDRDFVALEVSEYIERLARLRPFGQSDNTAFNGFIAKIRRAGREALDSSG